MDQSFAHRRTRNVSALRIKPVVAEHPLVEHLCAVVDAHPVHNHPLFSHLQTLAKNRRLVAEQFAILRKGFLGRIFPTMINITELASWAIAHRQYAVLRTALQNLNEESGATTEGNALVFGTPHPVLAEQALNAVAKHVFQLPDITCKQAYDDVRWPDEITQRAVFAHAYQTHPVIASWVQERASGGDNSAHKGMMGELFEVFAALQEHMSPATFESQVVPYFASHLTLEKNNEGLFRQVISASSVEYQHGERAFADLRAYLDTQPLSSEQATALAVAMLNAQTNLFHALLKEIGLYET